MTKELEITKRLCEAIKQSDEYQKGYILGFIEGLTLQGHDNEGKEKEKEN